LPRIPLSQDVIQPTTCEKIQLKANIENVEELKLCQEMS
jgi:hypothetical protein